MSIRNPREVHATFAKAFNSGDLDALVALYEKDATLVPGAGGPVTGQAAIREAYQGYLLMHPIITIETKAVYETNGVALLHGAWKLSGAGPDGAPIEMAGRNSEVVRRQPDGSWLFVIDNPFTPE